MKILSLLQIVIYMLLLEGCAVATFISTVAISTKIAIDPRTMGMQIDDGTLKLRINKVILENEFIKKKSRINAIVYCGKVLLIGQTPYPWLLSYIKRIIMKVEGVTEVYNEIRQTKPINFNTILSDTWITIKIRLILFNNNHIRSSNVKIITENNEVFLLGLVTENESKILTNIVNHVGGVKRVITIFTKF